LEAAAGKGFDVHVVISANLDILSVSKIANRSVRPMIDIKPPKSASPSRREFVLAGAGLTAASLAAFSAIDAAAAENATSLAPSGKPLIEPGATILFQGDSITDAGRKYDDSAANSQPALGNGYAWLAASQLLVDRPSDDLRIFNRGVSGNRVNDLTDRWQADCLDLKPAVLSILIGVNDFWHLIEHNYDRTLEQYEADYHTLAKRTTEALPGVKLVICEPFVVKTGAVNDAWFPGFDGYRAAAKRVAESAGATFVPFQTMFDLAVKIAPPERWAADGVHPTNDGAALMAHWWLKAVGT
jgi:lysophospholipase L1-like esterase